jgi:hypothetical protein
MKNPSPQHQKLVTALVDHFRNKLGLTILSATLPNFTAPVAHGRHEPDIIARDSNGVLHLAEAKASYEDIFSETAKEQFVDFSNRIMTGTNTPVPFHIVVYKEDEPNLLTRLNQLGLGSLVGNRIKIWTL